MRRKIKNFGMKAFWGGLWASIFAFLTKNWDTLADAPLVFAGSLFIGGLIGLGAAQIYNHDRINKWRERLEGWEERLKGKDEDIQRRNEKIIELKEKLSTEINPELIEISEMQNEIKETDIEETQEIELEEKVSEKKENIEVDSSIDEKDTTVKTPDPPRSLEEIRAYILLVVQSPLKIEKYLQDKTEHGRTVWTKMADRDNWTEEELKERLITSELSARAETIRAFKPSLIRISKAVTDELRQKGLDVEAIQNEDINSLEALIEKTKYLREDFCDSLKSKYTK